MFGREKRELRRLLTTDGTTSHSQQNRTGNELTDISEFKPISRHSPLQTSHHKHPTKGLSESNPRIRRTLSASASNRQSTKTRSSAGTFELHQGTSATFRNISLIPMRPTPTSISTTSCSNRFPTSGPIVSGNGLDSGERDCAGGGGGVNHVVTLPNLLLKPPEITFEEVLTAPSTPSNEQQPQDGGQVHFSVDGGSKLMLATGSPGSSVTGSSNHLQTNPNQQAVMVTPRGSLVTLCHSPLEFRESSYTVNYQDESDDGEEVCLMYTRHEKIPMKDFSAEIRASMDVENFLSQAQLLLDLQATSLEHIMDCLLHHLLDGEELPTAFAEAKKILFTHNSVHQLSKTIQSTCRTYSGGFDYDQSWLCVLCNVPSVQKRNVAIARLKQPANLGRTSQEVWFIVLIITPTKEKGTKNALETGRTFSTLFADMDLRLRLLAARTEEDFKQLLWEHMKELAEERGSPERKLSKDSTSRKDDVCMPGKEKCCFAGGLKADLRRRLPYYWSDYKDGFVGHGTLRKTAATTIFLYFACILPAIALGVLNYDNTNGYIDVKKVIYSQTIGGIVFAVFGGQPMVILLTTAPLALYTKVIYHICQDWNLDFAAMFAWTGLWNSFFLLIYAVTDASRLMKWSTRSTEEIFALFMAITFTVDAFKDVVTDFKLNYHSTSCEKHVKTGGADFDVDDNVSFPYRRRQNSTSLPSTIVAIAGMVVDEIVSSAVRRSTGQSTTSLSSTGDGQTAVTEADHTSQPQQPPIAECMRENSLLYLLLMLGTVWLSLSLYNFTKTPFLNANKRTLLADCALPVSVILMSFFGSYVFQDVKLEQFKLFSGDIFSRAPLWKLSWPAIFGAMGLGFFLSLLFFMDQSISGAMVNSPENRLKKGPAYHWDLLVVALLNAVLTYFGLPMVHGALPHSPLHVRAMADVEDRVDQGHVYQRIIFVRETRVTGILCHVLIGLSLFCIDKLKLIPRPVLDGLFLYLAITALHHNQLFERIMLLVTEQAAYPPNHYIRTVPQRKVHLFTLLQLVQLVVLCAFGFAPLPYLKMVFPILLLLLLPTRHKVVPFLVEKKFLLSLDG